MNKLLVWLLLPVWIGGLTSFSLNAQNARQELLGLVVHDVSRQPVSNAVVSVLGCNEVRTDNQGQFRLNIGPVYDEGARFEIFVNHPDYGFHSVEKNMSNNLLRDPVKIEMPRNNKIGVHGIVYDSQTKKLVPGVKVTLSSSSLAPDLPNPVVETDAFGVFKIPISKRALNRPMEYADLLVQDPQARYADKRETASVLAPVEIYLDRGGKRLKRNFQINGFFRIELNLKQGDLIEIKASGNINVGRIIGTLGPEGKSSGFAGISLAIYSIEPTFNHGALMYRIEGEEEWRLCGESCRFIAPNEGPTTLFFQVNDNKQNDNHGHFEVEVGVE